jgi:hypothetical protein
MAKKQYRVVVSSLAYVSQTILVEAKNADEAEDLVFDQELWNNGVWDYEGVTSQKPDLNYTELA